MNSYATTAFHYFKCIRENIPTIVCLYFGIVLAHFACSNIYPTWCCNNSLYGFIMTPFMIVTPHCEALRWIIHYTGEQIRNVWLWIGGYLIYYITSIVTQYFTTFRANVRPNDVNSNTTGNVETEETVRRRT